MNELYLTIEESNTHEIEVNKSRFIGTVFHVKTEQEAQEKLAKIRKTYADATHNCYAYVLNIDRQTRKFSDDGEPGGTAGQPIFHVIDKSELTNILIVITRYFGGIKLGAGGLVRAYTKATTSLIENSNVVYYEEHTIVTYSIEYHYLGSVQNYLETENILVLDTQYTDLVSLTIALPQTQTIDFALANLTNGSIKKEKETLDIIQVSK